MTTTPPFFRARIVSIDTTGSGSRLRPTGTVTVRPLIPYVGTGTADGTIPGVVPLLAGFENPATRPAPPTGISYAPKVGAIVLVAFDGSRHVIAGYYPGPLTTPGDTPGDDKQVTSFNAAPDNDQSRAIANPGLDVIPGWSDALEPGDISLGNGTARVKVSAVGVKVGVGPSCCAIYKANEHIEQAAIYSVRRVGYQEIHTFSTAAPEAAATDDDPALTVTNRAASVYSSRVFEHSPYYDVQAPYTVEQRGILPASILPVGRGAIVAMPLSNDVLQAALSGRYVVYQTVTAIPQSAASPTRVGNDLERDRAVRRYREWNDGSWQLECAASTPDRYEFIQQFDARSHQYSIRIGISGSEKATITVDATSGNLSVKAAAISVQADSVQVDAKSDCVISATHGTLKIPELTLDGTVTVTGDLAVQGTASAAVDVVIGTTLGLLTHTHDTSTGLPV